VAKPEFPLQFLKDEVENARNSLPEICNSKAGNPEFWINYYETDLVTWQAPVTSPWLVRYMKEFLGSESKRVFVPLCGKSLDLKLLLDSGHHVIGAECSGIACSDFFIENNIPDYQKEEVNHPNGVRLVRHKSGSLPIEIYEGDVFDLSVDVLGCPVDAVLDRAALVALPPCLIEEKYLPLVTSLMKPDAKMLFASVSELPFPKAPPHIYENDMVERLLQGFFLNIEQKEVYRYRVNAGYVSEPIYMLTGKRSS
jgi:thiopurine S-methyltransferase